MGLFKSDHTRNILPHDGAVFYHNDMLRAEEATFFFDRLWETIVWKNDEAVIFGKHFTTKRKVAWYGEKPFAYTYSNTTKYALPWTEELLSLKIIAEKITTTTFNTCLLNLYHDGAEGMGWHSDDEKSLKKHAVIASISLGAERKFAFKHKVNKQVISLQLETGSLLTMQGETQTNWLHRLPLTKKIHRPRINLTFRNMIDNS